MLAYFVGGLHVQKLPSGIQQVDECSHAECKRCGRGRFDAESPFSIKSHA